MACTLLSPFEIGVQGGSEQRFAEPARAAEKNVLVFCHLPYKVGLVNIDVIAFPYLRKGLDSNGIFPFCRLLHGRVNLNLQRYKKKRYGTHAVR